MIRIQIYYTLVAYIFLEVFMCFIMPPTGDFVLCCEVSTYNIDQSPIFSGTSGGVLRKPFQRRDYVMW